MLRVQPPWPVIRASRCPRDRCSGCLSASRSLAGLGASPGYLAWRSPLSKPSKRGNRRGFLPPQNWSDDSLRGVFHAMSNPGGVRRGVGQRVTIEETHRRLEERMPMALGKQARAKQPFSLDDGGLLATWHVLVSTGTSPGDSSEFCRLRRDQKRCPGALSETTATTERGDGVSLGRCLRFAEHELDHGGDLLARSFRRIGWPQGSVRRRPRMTATHG